jgi:alpha-beta hydrolase superfamily lysophospholipase
LYTLAVPLALQSPDKELRILKGAGHFIWREQGNQAVFTDVIAWLRAHGSTDARLADA